MTDIFLSERELLSLFNDIQHEDQTSVNNFIYQISQLPATSSAPDVNYQMIDDGATLDADIEEFCSNLEDILQESASRQVSPLGTPKSQSVADFQSDNFSVASISASSNSSYSMDPEQAAATQELIKRTVRKLKPKIPASVSSQKIPFKMFHKYTPDLSSAFNIGDINGIANIVHKMAHNRCLYRIKNPLQVIENIGADNLVDFYGSLQQIYPDGMMVCKKMKTYEEGNFDVIQWKMDFLGTQFDKKLSRATFAPHFDNTHEADFMSVSGEERDKYVAIEDKISESGGMLHLLVKVVATSYVDRESNRVVLHDVRFKVASFSESFLPSPLKKPA